MNLIELVLRKLGWLQPGMASKLEQGLTAVPGVQKAVEQEYDAMLAQLETAVKPYADEFPTFRQLPEASVGRPEVLEWMEALEQLRAEPDFHTLGVPDLVNRLIANGHAPQVQYISGHWMDINNLEDLSRAGDFAHGQTN